ncbi:MAG: hypothetical protein KC416_00065, partial [Myxococcales bacterium]|nr:hypothetical protein [Myxococcales bacterium]
ASGDCLTDLACAAGTCVPTDGPCTDDTDCGGDTYCCGDDCLPPGETQSVCIPYGQGPRGDVNDMCLGEVTIGVFAPSTQCSFTDPPMGDPFPDHKNILTTPLVADTPFDSGAAVEILIVAYNGDDGGSQAAVGSSAGKFGVVRILNGQTCAQHQALRDGANDIIAASPPAVGDLDGDGRVEIVTHHRLGGLVAFHWDPVSSKYITYWVSSGGVSPLVRGAHLDNVNRWDGPALHDLDNDGFPEVLSGSEVYNGRTGQRINLSQDLSATAYISPGSIAVVGDLDGDQIPEYIDQDVWSWSTVAQEWVYAYPGFSKSFHHFAYADFGTAGANPEDFDPTTLDGVPEIVGTGLSQATIVTLSGQEILYWNKSGEGGGPPTIGDFDNDGFPEIAAAWKTAYRIFDLDCLGPNNPAGCADKFVRWFRPSQDSSSNRTGSSIFDFDGDGQAEAVYGDECYTRVYDGKGGEVLYSAFRSSCTWYENPIVADPDRDSSSEILVGSNTNCDIVCDAVDPIHRGELCEADTDCFSGTCDEGFCRCGEQSDCQGETVCADPPMGTPGMGKTCRAAQGTQKKYGLFVLRDRLDRWASSRPLWNQHAYSVTNVNDDGSIPQSSNWLPNYAQPGLNNFRQNVQGDTGAEDLPDITGKTSDAVCQFSGGKVTLTATVCNRGNRTVGAAMPATFYKGNPTDNNILCTSYTEGPVPVGGCLEVSCEIGEKLDGTVTMVVNDDGQGGKTTVECNDDNNTDAVTIKECVPLK